VGASPNCWQDMNEMFTQYNGLSMDTWYTIITTRFDKDYWVNLNGAQTWDGKATRAPPNSKGVYYLGQTDSLSWNTPGWCSTGFTSLNIKRVKYECYSHTESCDGWDNNCDNIVDNGLTRPSRVCNVGIGECRGEGLEYKTCYGVNGWSSTYSGCTAVEGSPTTEICDGKDNNCNGVNDDGLTRPSRTCYAGVGQCRRAGTEYKTCNGAAGWSSTYSGCTAVAGSPTAEQCDALDHDCDGDPYNGLECRPSDPGCNADCTLVECDGLPIGTTQPCYTGPPGTQGFGICTGGTETCQADGTWSSCIGEVTPQIESSAQGNCADLINNDCDLEMDWDFIGLMHGERECPISITDISIGTQP